MSSKPSVPQAARFDSHALMSDTRITLHGKDEALRLKTDKMETIPIAVPSKRLKQSISKLVPKLEQLAAVRLEAQRDISGWLSHTFSISADVWRKSDLTAVDVDEFIRRVSDELPGRRKLSAADIVELKREYEATLKPAVKSRSDSLNLEQEIAALVNEAYGLTEEDIQLMWRTAPPRMPFTPQGLAYFEETEDGSEDEEAGD